MVLNMMDQSMRIGILTGGGDCPGLNAVIRAVVKTGVHQHQDKIIGISDGFTGLIHNRVRTLSLDLVSGIMPRGGTILGASNRDNPFKYMEYLGGSMVQRDVSGIVLENCKKNKLDCLIVIGGDGTLDIAHKFSEKGLKVIGIPKTIDNDLSATDVTFGFDTAIGTVVDALDKIHTTAESHHRIMVVEVMGRDAGWIATAAGIAGGAHIILIPEVPFYYEKIAQKVSQRKESGKYFTVVVVAEGAMPAGGERSIKRIIEGSHEKVRLGGIGEQVAMELETITRLEARTTVLGHIQRGGSPSAFDRILSTRYGAAAVFHAHEGNFNTMMALRTPKIIPVPLKEALHHMKRVDPKGSHVITARRIGISFGD